jgi:hypothetical protein
MDKFILFSFRIPSCRPSLLSKHCHEDIRGSGGIAPPLFTPYAFMAYCLVKQAQGQLYLYMDNFLLCVLKEIVNMIIKSQWMTKTFN